ncbi:MAG: type II CRISPR RNA-guided endonuclease Cas9 [Phascolarctobacterium sp.]|nr:type II CRISPR RNA-guided endonuclease Cas9 [Phascolarctobacterium sp.]
MAYGIGLDIGIASVGWAVVDLDYDENPMGIIDLGVEIFDKAENADGSPLALPRREARSARRRLRRHRHRLERIKKLFVQEKLISENGLNNLFGGKLKDIYQLRTEALDTLLTDEEMVRVLIHIAQRRGFKSNRKSEKNEKDNGKLLTAVDENKKRMQEKGYRTVGEMFYKDALFAEHKRNKDGEYLATVGRADIENEIKKIFAKQYDLGNKKFNETLMNKYLDIVLSQRNFDEGPGDDSPYGGNQIEKMIGICTFLNKKNGNKTNEPRAPKASFSVEYFTLLQKVNNLRLFDDGEKLPLDDEQRGKVIELAKSKADINYAMIRKELGLSNDILFDTLNYSENNFDSFEKKQKYNDSQLGDLCFLINGQMVAFNAEQKEKVIALMNSKKRVNYAQIRKVLGLNKNTLFGNLDYPNWTIEEFEKKQKFNYLKVYHQMRIALDKIAKNHIKSYDIATLDEIGRILSIYKGDDRRKEELSKIGITSNEEIEALLEISGVTKFSHLSLKAIYAITPSLEKGLKYNEACSVAGFDFKGHGNGKKSKFLPKYNDDMKQITSPVVRRAISHTIRVVNAIINKQGISPTYINVELAREMAKDFEERQKIKNQYDKNREDNERMMQEIKEGKFGINDPKGQDLVKYKLFKEQDGRSPYSQKAFNVQRLFEPGYVEVDHIIPYSLCFDDSYKNKVLVLKEENQKKKNRTPIQYLAQEFGQSAVEKFTIWIKNSNLNSKKKMNLLTKETEFSGFKERNLTDTKFASIFILNYIRDYLEFAESSTGRKERVTAVNGVITSYLRKCWGIEKIRANGDTHHAKDAVVIACVTNKMEQEVTHYNMIKETTGFLTAKDKKLPLPYQDFRREVICRTCDDPVRMLEEEHIPYYADKDLHSFKPIFVSRMRRKKVTGAAHEATIRGVSIVDGKYYSVSKVSLTELNLGKDGEIEDYYNLKDDLLLYNALKVRLQEHNGKGKEAFSESEPFYKPKSDGTPGNLVKKVKKINNMTVIPVGTRGYAKNGDMIRIDVFLTEEDGYYFVPIYVADTVNKTLPNRACIDGKLRSEWKEMKEEDFLFSLYHNDLIYIKRKEPIPMSKINKKSNMEDKIYVNDAFLYFQDANAFHASINVINDDNTYGQDTLRIKNVEVFEKYQVDVLGNITKVGKETRQKFK